jgi:hypothetical protein
MTWQSIRVIGVPSRQAVDACVASSVATVELELEEDALPPNSWEISGMWFVSLRLTDTEASDSPRTTSPADLSDLGLEARYVGVIAGTDIPARVIFVGEVLYGFEIGL